MTHAVDAIDISCQLGGRPILNNVNVSISRGELLTLVGPSGCGKSTLLRVIAGLQPSSGRVVLNGADVTDLPAEKRRVGLVFQSNALFGHLNVQRNVAFGLRHLPKTERRDRVEEMLSLVKLSSLANRFPHELSGGEQQRIALARALAPEPSVVLLDEPFGALDEVLREDLGWEVKEILAQRNTAAMLVTHDRREALALGTRVAVMENGAILQCDSPRGIYDNPNSRFVAEFLSVSSYLPNEAGDVVLVRPHQLMVERGGPHTVIRVEFVGAMSRCTIQLEDTSMVVADVEPDTALTAGDSCRVRIR